MFEKYRKFLFSKRVAKQQPRNVRFPVYDDIKTVLLLYQSDETDQNKEINDIVSLLLHDGKTVDTFGYADKRRIVSPDLPQSRMICRKDVSFSLRPKKEIMSELITHKYDLLIDLTMQYCLPLHYTAMYADAVFKTGRHIVDGLHDMMIDMPQNGNPMSLYNQIIHFLNIIKSNDK